MQKDRTNVVANPDRCKTLRHVMGNIIRLAKQRGHTVTQPEIVRIGEANGLKLSVSYLRQSMRQDEILKLQGDRYRPKGLFSFELIWLLCREYHIRIEDAFKGVE